VGDSSHEKSLKSNLDQGEGEKEGERRCQRSVVPGREDANIEQAGWTKRGRREEREGETFGVFSDLREESSISCRWAARGGGEDYLSSFYRVGEKKK